MEDPGEIIGSDGFSGGACLRDGFLSPGLPVNPVRRFLQGTRWAGDNHGRAPMQLVFKRKSISANQQNQNDDDGHTLAGACALDKCAENPGGEGNEDERKQNGHG